MGYEKTLFYLTKGDFSFHHTASMLLRLNLLAWALTFIMDTDYMAYYLSPLISFWYIVVYVIMAAGQRYNEDFRVLVAKIVGTGALISGVLHFTPLVSWSHFLVKLLFKAQFSEDVWEKHITANMYIVYVGMLVAVLSKYASPSAIITEHRIPLAVGSLVFSAICVHNSRKTDEDGYLDFHAAMSCVPILWYVVLRNISSKARSYHSYAMAWAGRCYLELSNLQAHLYLASTAQGVLLVDGLSFGDATFIGRLGSLAITVPIFLWVSSAASEATKQLVELLLGDQESEAEKRLENANILMKVLRIPVFKVGMLCTVLWVMNLMSPLPLTASAL